MDNHASGLDLGGGGAIFSYYGAIDLRDARFSANRAAGEGGGAIQSRGTLRIEDSRFDANVAYLHGKPLPDSYDGFGGALLLIEGSAIDITRTTFTGNQASNSGGAIYNDQRNELRVTASLLDGNVAKGEMLQAAGGFGGGIHNESKLYLTDSTISANQARGGGGGVTLNQAAELVAKNTAIVHNKASDGGGIAAYTGVARLENSVLEGNQATAGSAFGGGLLNDAATVTVVDSRIRNNRAGIGGAFSINSGGTVKITTSDVSGNVAAVDGSAFVNFNRGRVELKGSTLGGSYRNHPGSTFLDLGGNTFLP
ncbi:hypothetical protein [Melaminivora suipulveris]|uniref:hypothetical protein n=1 Tax=Melaminivora suipulveris TaxID=2109913 RepID=UPI00131A4E46|nr:hypothetical protein [Melaminivora suipulveris]